MLKVTEESKTYIIYKHVSPSGKVYIGQTNQIPELRFRNGEGYRSSKKFYNAILKYGWKNFKHEILFTSLNKISADCIETDLIYYYKQIGIYVREGKLPRGKHEIGFKELSWSKKELDEFVKKCRNSTLLHSKKHSLA